MDTTPTPSDKDQTGTPNIISPDTTPETRADTPTNDASPTTHDTGAETPTLAPTTPDLAASPENAVADATPLPSPSTNPTVSMPTASTPPVLPSSPVSPVTTDSPAPTSNNGASNNTVSEAPFSFANVQPTAGASQPPTSIAPLNVSPLRRLTLPIIGAALLGLLILLITAAVSYAAGSRAIKPTADTSNASTFTLPAGATIIEQCSPGLGTQYILPKNIPNGPVYNVYQGKLIGIEYMEDLTSMEKLNTTLTNLPLFGETYDHINIMTMPPHAGMPMPHYQVDVMMVSAATAAKITCGSSSGMNSGSTNTTTTPKSSSSNMSM